MRGSDRPKERQRDREKEIEKEGGERKKREEEREIERDQSVASTRSIRTCSNKHYIVHIHLSISFRDTLLMTTTVDIGASTQKPSQLFCSSI